MQALTIGEVARRVGIRPSAIRYYEAEGLLPSAPRTSGRRCFDAAAVSRLQVIRAARELGFTLDEIRQLLETYSPDVGPSKRWRALAGSKLPEIDAALRRLRALRRLVVAGMSCACETIDECILEDCSTPGFVPLLARGRAPVGAALERPAS